MSAQSRSRFRDLLKDRGRRMTHENETSGLAKLIGRRVNIYYKVTAGVSGYGGLVTDVDSGLLELNGGRWVNARFAERIETISEK